MRHISNFGVSRGRTKDEGEVVEREREVSTLAPRRSEAYNTIPKYRNQNASISKTRTWKQRGSPDFPPGNGKKGEDKKG